MLPVEAEELRPDAAEGGRSGAGDGLLGPPGALRALMLPVQGSIGNSLDALEGSWAASPSPLLTQDRCVLPSGAGAQERFHVLPPQAAQCKQ